MSELTIPERVAAGAAWLDENRPGWVEAIDLAELDVSSCTLCVLGQIFGDYYDAPRAAKFDSDNTTQAARERGFEIPYGTYDHRGEYAELTAEWRRLIESRRSKADGWRDDATGLVSGGLVASCSVCGHIDESEPHDCGAVS